MKPFATVLFSIVFVNTYAQYWSTSGNSGLTDANFLGTTDKQSLIFKTLSGEAGRLLNTGTWQFGSSTNNALIDKTGKLLFTGTGGYFVGSNKYVFQYSGNTAKGLFINTTSNQYEFRNVNNAALLFINTDNGNSGVLGSFKIGNYTLPATDGTSGQLLATNGSGAVNWITPSGNISGANTALSNLISTSINKSLIPGTDSTIDLGNKVKAWRNLFIATRIAIGSSPPAARLGIRTGNSDTSFAVLINHLLPAGPILPSIVATIFSVKDNGNVGIGTNTPAYPLNVMGDVEFADLGGSSCDFRLRTSATNMGFFASSSVDKMVLYNYASLKSLMTVLGNGNVGINTTTPDYTLDVCGAIRAKEILAQTGWCDYVFDKNYKLKPIEEVADFISNYKHLPGIPAANEVETKGLKVADMSAKMMEKIEELTLYLIQQNQRIVKQNDQIQSLQKKIEALEKSK